MHTQLILLTLLVLGSTPALAVKLTGVVTNPSAATLEFRTATEDIQIDRSDLSPEQLKQLTDPSASKSIFTADVPDSAISSRTAVPNGLRADCTELPLSEEEFDKIITSPDVKSAADLNRALPPGTMQGFTYVTKSLSAQKGTGESEVREEFPRVLRMNAEGTITYSYTCDPKSETYGHVEALFFDKKGNKLRGKSYKLDKPAGTVGPNQRMHGTPSSCVTCHTTGKKINGELSMKHNWPEYFFWGDCQKKRGITFYGMSDDNMGDAVYRERIQVSRLTYQQCDAVQDRAAHDQMKKDYENFREKQKDNPCYNTLPNPQGEDPSRDGLSYKYYPYADVAQATNLSGKNDYSLRTNARITDIYSRLLTRRNVEIIKKSPDYEKMKYYIAMEGAGCINESDVEALKKMMPNLKNLSVGMENPFTAQIPTDSPILYNFSLAAGLNPADWSMQYVPNTDYQDPNYNSVMFKENFMGDAGDFGMKDTTAGEILKDIAAADPLIRTATAEVFSKGSADVFGERHGCIDDLAQGIRTNSKGPENDLCKALRAQNNAHINNIRAEMCKNPTDTASTDTQVSTALTALEKLKAEIKDKEDDEFKASVERGRKLTQKDGAAHCVKCHGRTPENVQSKPSSFLFIPTEGVDPAEHKTGLETMRRRVNEGFMKEIEDQIDMGMMPADGSISAQDGKDVVNYLQSLVTRD